MTMRQLMWLYPAAWRRRYEDEFLHLTGEGPLTLPQVVDVVAGAIDARRAAAGREVMMRVVSHGCRSGGYRMSTRDGLIGAGVLLLVSLMGTWCATWLRASGFDQASQFALYIAFPLSAVASMPFTSLKGQSWRAQVAITGGLTVTLCLIWWLTRLV